MSTNDAIEDAVDVLQELGLKEYEAKCFAGLSRVSTGTAKRLSEITDVPRTRVYDAIRVLEAQGLVEIQHTSPQQFRAVPLDEATETLRDRYDDRIERLASALDEADAVHHEDEDTIQEVWSLTGNDAISNRTMRVIDEGTDEIVLVIGHESLFTTELAEVLLAKADAGADLVIGTVDESLEKHIQDTVPAAQTFVSGLDWLHGDVDDDLAIGRMLLVDRSTILVSTILPDSGDEHAIFGGGFRNGLVVIARRLMAQGLITARDPAET